MTKYILIVLLFPFFLDAQNVFISGDIDICSNSHNDAQVTVSFANGVPPYSFVYAIDGVNQGNIMTNVNPYYIENKTPGIYTITYFSDAVSTGIISGSARVGIMDAPVCSFLTDSDTVSVLYKTIKLQDISTGNIVSWQWDFGDGNISSQPNPYHSFEGSLGVYQISLIVTDDMGCSDTSKKQIWIAEDYWIYVPNTFTPNNDNLNDRFCIEYNGIREETFIFRVFGPLGNLVYESNSPNTLRCSTNGGWDGRSLTGEDVPDTHPLLVKDAYTYLLDFQDFEGWKHRKNGYIKLIR